ncbi:hypothetical protein BANRA_05405 [Escherichia coli]|nr:hypothetical protein BANRA_05405 [Escherichia coli]
MAEQLCPLFCVFSGGWYPASAITLYAVLAGHGADGGLWGISGMCNVVYLLGPSGMVAGEAIIISITGGGVVRTVHGLFPLVAQES